MHGRVKNTEGSCYPVWRYAEKFVEKRKKKNNRISTQQRFSLR